MEQYVSTYLASPAVNFVFTGCYQEKMTCGWTTSIGAETSWPDGKAVVSSFNVTYKDCELRQMSFHRYITISVIGVSCISIYRNFIFP